MSMKPTAKRSSAPLPLCGFRVIDLGNYIAGPGAAMTLCELGAEVIKIESPQGDMARHMGHYGSAMLRSFNRSKKSIALDLRTAEGLDIAQKLIAAADVVIQNLRPLAALQLGLGAEAVRKLHPQLVYVSITGFPETGPSRHRAGYDIAAQAESGLMSLTGEPDGDAQKVGAPIIDAATAQIAAQAVLAALLRRTRWGIGETIEVSLLEVALHLQMATWTDYLARSVEPFRTGDGQPLNAPAADLIRTSDGQIVLSAYIEAHWTRLCSALGVTELAQDPRFCSNALRVANRGAMRALLSQALSGMTTEDAIKLLSSHNIVAGAVRRYSDVLASEDLRQSEMFITVKARGQMGEYQSFGLPYRMRDTCRQTTCGPPCVGADTVEILGTLGFSMDEIEGLKQKAIIKTSP